MGMPMLWSKLVRFLKRVWLLVLMEFGYEPDSIAPPQPPRVLFLLKRKVKRMSRWKYTFGLPAPGAPDVVSRIFKVKQEVVGSEPLEVEIPVAGDATEVSMELLSGASVSVTLTDVDNAGNKSIESPALIFNVEDDVPPPKPGELGVIAKEEVFA